MHSIYFLCLNALQFVPYAYGLLKNYAELDPGIRENYQWHEPLHRMEPEDRLRRRRDAGQIPRLGRHRHTGADGMPIIQANSKP